MFSRSRGCMADAGLLECGPLARPGRDRGIQSAPNTGEKPMLEKWLCLVAFLIAALLAIVSLLDLVTGIPFAKQSTVHDIILLVAAAVICWQSLEVWRQIA